MMLLHAASYNSQKQYWAVFWCILTQYLLSTESSVLIISGCELQLLGASAMTTIKVNQKLVEDLRLQKRILRLTQDDDDEQDNVFPKLSPGPYPGMTSGEILEKYYQKRANKMARQDDEDHINILDGRRNSAASTVSKFNRRKSQVSEESSKQLVPYETHRNSKFFPDMSLYYHYNNLTGDRHLHHHHQQQQQEEQKNLINKRVTVNGISTYRGGPERADPTTRGYVSNNSMNDNYYYYNYNNKSQGKRNSHHHQSRRSLDLGEANRHYFSDSDLVQNNSNHYNNNNNNMKNVIQAPSSYLQLREISRGAQKLSDILKNNDHNNNNNSSSDGLKSKRSDVGRDLLKGAMDLEESLRMLAKFQKAATRNINLVEGRQSADHLKEIIPYNSKVLQVKNEEPRYSYDGREHFIKEFPERFRGSKEPGRLSLDGRDLSTKSSTLDLREAIKASLSRQKLQYNNSSVKTVDAGHKHDRLSNSNSASNAQDSKRRIPNVIARLMGLEELPSESSPKTNGIINHASMGSKLVQDNLAPLKITNSSMANRYREESRATRPEQAAGLRQQESPRKPTTTQSREPQQDSDHRSRAYMNPEEYHETIKAALNRVKQHAQKQSLELDSPTKNRLKCVGDDQSPHPERKTLKQILEAMRIKGILGRPEPDDQIHEAPNSNPVQSTHAEVKQKPARKIQEQQIQGSIPDNGFTKRNSHTSDKIAKETTSIVIMKPVPSSATVQKVQNSPKTAQLHEKTAATVSRKQGNTAKNIPNPSPNSSPSKKKLSKPALGKADEGQSKKNHNSISGNQEGPRGPKQVSSVSDHGNQSKSQPSSAVFQELKRRRSERISKATNKAVERSSPPGLKQEKKKSVHDSAIKEKGSISRTRPKTELGSTEAITSNSKQKPKEKPLVQNPQMRNAMEANTVSEAVTIDRDVADEDDDKEASLNTFTARSDDSKDPNVENLKCASAEENHMAGCELPSAGGEAAPASISPVSVLQLPPEVDEDEDQEEEEEGQHESSLPVDLRDSDIKTEPICEEHEGSITRSNHDELSNNYSNADGPEGNFLKKITFYEEHDREKKWQKDFVRRILMNNPTLINAEAADSIELYPQLYYKLEEEEAAMFSSDNNAKQRREGDDVERRLVIEVVKELLKRKTRRRMQMNQPMVTTLIRSVGIKRKNIDELVEELCDDIDELMGYHVVAYDDTSNEKFESDSLETMLMRDLTVRHYDINSIWKPSWDNGMCGEDEGQEIGRDIEKLVFDELLEEFIFDQVLLP
eukprot:Gb_07004 [translate_table: standard]